MESTDSRTLIEGGRAEPSPELPRRLGRFRLDRLLGRGGMGQVFAAWDPRLSRRVAIKLMREVELRLRLRFLREARAQAALSHPAICPVYEVGEDGGVPFIVMQYLDGQPLDQAAEPLPLEAKLKLMRQVAEAVHEAHRAGLIHRDLKPSNVLVEMPAGEAPRPFVLDFGLARPLGPALAGGLGGTMTEEGAMLGSPAYMAPEQVRGELDALDHRTDVYGLGATLYHLLAGKPPFHVSGPAFALEVLERDPPSLRAAGVPPEVEHIVFKCLEKEPARRYASAAALAEDLRRYLEGEPILARPASRGYRLVKWVRRHQALATSLLALLLTLAGSLGWSVYADRRARQREQLVSFFVEDVADVEAQVRYSYMAPLHDIRPDRELLRQRMAHIRSEMERFDTATTGAGHYALGSGHLALEELDGAHQELEAAWRAGYRPRETAAALALTLSALYREKLSDLELVQDWDSRQRRLADLERRYGDPLRAYFARSQPGEAEPLLTALAHFHRDQFAAAIAALQASPAGMPWSYELPLLEGEIRRAWAIKKSFEGDSDGSRRELELAQAAYGRAVAVAESDPAIHRALAQVAYQLLGLAAGKQEAPAQLVEAGVAAAERALVAHPDDARAWLWKARIHRVAAADLQVKGADPTAHLEPAADAAERAAHGLRPPAPAWRELARARWGLARWRESRGEDPQADLDGAVAALGRVPQAGREYQDEFLTAMIYQTRARYRSVRGKDAASDFQAAIASYRAAISRHSKPASAWINLGQSALALADLGGAGDADRWLQQAVDAFTRAQAMQPASSVPAYYLGRVYLRLAQGGDPASEQLDPTWTTRAIDSYHQALELAPAMFAAHIGLGEVHHLQALQAAAQGQAPDELFHRARVAYEQALKLAPENDVAWLNLAWTDYFQGKLRVRAGRDPASYLQRAIERSRRAFDATGRPQPLLCLASAYRIDAEWRLRSGAGGVREAIERARSGLEQLLKLDPKHPEGHRSMGRLLTLEASWQRHQGEDPRPTLNAARHWLDQALELQPEGADYWLALARLELEESNAEARARGLRAAAKALELRPGWVSAEAVRQALAGGTSE